MFVLTDDAFAGVALLADNVTENAAFFLVVIVPAVVDFFAHAARDDRQGNQLRVGMIDGRPGSFSVILENENVAKALIVLQVQHAVAITPKHVLHGTFRQRGKRCKMVRRLNHHFVRADSTHLVKETFALAVQFTLNSQRGKFVRHHADTPARRVGTSAVPAVHKNFRRSPSFVARAEGAILLFSWDDALTEKVVRPLPAFR